MVIDEDPNKIVEHGNVNARTKRIKKELTPLHKEQRVPLRSPSGSDIVRKGDASVPGRGFL
jgi:hypothetical protein